MKFTTFNRYASFFALLCVAAGLFFFAACSKEGGSAPTDGQADIQGKFSKDIALTDARTGSTAVLQVSSDDEQALAALNAQAFEITTLDEIGAVTEGQDHQAATAADAPQALKSTDTPPAALHFNLKSSDLKSKAKALVIQIKAGAVPEGPVDWWYHNSDCYMYTVSYGNTYYAEGWYKNFWPFWTRYNVPGWTTATSSYVSGCGNMSLHVTYITGALTVIRY